jgi:hypothetical protein
VNESIDVAHKPLAVREEQPFGHDLALPVVSPEEAKAAMTQYLELCEAVLDKSDYQEFTQKRREKVNGKWQDVFEKKAFKKKSAVKKLQTFFGVEVIVKETARDDLGEGNYGFRVVASARARNGRVVEASAACSTFEERFSLSQFDNESDAAFAVRQKKALARAYHDILSTAETRATNRAVMNCIGVGGGEVTADEMQRDSTHTRPGRPSPDPQPRNGTPQASEPPQRPATGQKTPSSEPDHSPMRLGKAMDEWRKLIAERGVSEKQATDLLIQLFPGYVQPNGGFDEASLSVQEWRVAYRELLDRTNSA